MYDIQYMVKECCRKHYHFGSPWYKSWHLQQRRNNSIFIMEYELLRDSYLDMVSISSYISQTFLMNCLCAWRYCSLLLFQCFHCNTHNGWYYQGMLETTSEGLILLQILNVTFKSMLYTKTGGIGYESCTNGLRCPKIRNDGVKYV